MTPTQGHQGAWQRWERGGCAGACACTGRAEQLQQGQVAGKEGEQGMGWAARGAVGRRGGGRCARWYGGHAGGMAGAALRRRGRTPWEERGGGLSGDGRSSAGYAEEQEEQCGGAGTATTRGRGGAPGESVGASTSRLRASAAPPARPGPARAPAAAPATSYRAASGRARPSPVVRGGVGSGPARCPAGGAGTGAGARRPQEPMATPGPARPSLGACARHRARRPLPAKKGEQDDVTAPLLKGQRRRARVTRRPCAAAGGAVRVPGPGTRAGRQAGRPSSGSSRTAKGSTGLRKSLPRQISTRPQQRRFPPNPKWNKHTERCGKAKPCLYSSLNKAFWV